MRIIVNNTLITKYTYEWILAVTMIYIKHKTDSDSLSDPNHFNQIHFL